MHAIEPNRELPLITHEKIIRRWSPSRENKGLELKSSLQLLERIEIICRCRIEQANESADFLIKADREQDIKKGFSKLKRVNKITVSLVSLPIGLETLLIDSTMAQKCVSFTRSQSLTSLKAYETSFPRIYSFLRSWWGRSTGTFPSGHGTLAYG